MKCEDGQHEKVFADFCYLANPPQYPWVCRKCGKEGVDCKGAAFDEYGSIKRRLERGDDSCLPLEH